MEEAKKSSDRDAIREAEKNFYLSAFLSSIGVLLPNSLLFKYAGLTSTGKSLFDAINLLSNQNNYNRILERRKEIIQTALQSYEKSGDSSSNNGAIAVNNPFGIINLVQQWLSKTQKR